MPRSDASNRSSVSHGGRGDAGLSDTVQFRVDPCGMITRATPGANALLGIAPETVGPMFDDHVVIAGQTPRPLSSIAAQSAWAPFTVRIVKGKHAGHHRRLRARGVPDEAGRLQYVVVVGEDETELRLNRQMKQLARSRAVSARGRRQDGLREASVPEESTLNQRPGGGVVVTSKTDGAATCALGIGVVEETLGGFYERIDTATVMRNLMEDADRDGCVAANALLHNLTSRILATHHLAHLKIEHSADATRIPGDAVSSVYFTAHEMLRILLHGDDGRPDTIRILLWSGVDGSWRMVARRLSTCGVLETPWSKNLGLLVDILGGSVLPAGYSGSGIAVVFPPFVKGGIA